MNKAEPALHEACEQIAFLLGTWRGEGSGEHRPIDAFRYTEELRFWHVGKPFLAYTQRTANADTGAPMHAEMGYWRPVAPGRIEMVIAHPTGIAEVQEGSIDGTTIDVATEVVVRTPTAKEVTRLERTFTIDGDVMRYTLRMAAVGRDLTEHLRAELRRVE